jgi:hypothetical protein
MIFVFIFGLWIAMMLMYVYEPSEKQIALNKKFNDETIESLRKTWAKQRERELKNKST